MKRILKKIRSIRLSSSALIFVAIFVIAIFGIQVSKIYAQNQNSILGGVNNSLIVQGKSLLANSVTSNDTGLAVINGRTGLGTTVANAKLHLRQTAGELVLRMENAASGGHNWELNAKTNGALSIIDRSMGADRLFISGDGNVGMGTVNPETKLEVQGRVTINTVSSNPYYEYPLLIQDSSKNPLFFVYPSGDVWSIGEGSFESIFTRDIQVTNNEWGACVSYFRPGSCTAQWDMTCQDGQYLAGLSNAGGSNSCVTSIRCCQL